MYPSAGVGYPVRETDVPPDLPLSRVLSLEVIDAFLPTQVDWKVMQRGNLASGFSAVTVVDRRMETAVLVNMPWELPGLWQVAVRQAGTAVAAWPIQTGTFSPVSVTHLPAGVYEWALEYVEGESTWTVDTQDVNVGLLTAEFLDVTVQALDSHSFSVAGTLRVTSDGPVEASTLSIAGRLTGHHFSLMPNRPDGKLTRDVLDDDIQIGTFSVGGFAEPEVLEVPFSHTVMTKATSGPERTIWELELHAQLTQGASALVVSPQTTWYAPVPEDASPAGFLTNDSVRTVRLSPGINLYTIEGFSGHGPVNMYLVQADLTHPSVTVGGLVAQDFIVSDHVQWALSTVSQMAARSGAIAATNANFFEIKATRNPRGIHLSSGKLLKSHNEGWNRSVGFTANGTPYFGVWHWHGIIRPAEAPTKFRGTAGLNITTASYDDIVIFRAPWRTSPGFRPESDGGLTVTELVVTGLVEENHAGQPVTGEPKNARVIRGTVREVRVGKPGIPISEDLLVVTGYGSAGEYLKQTYKPGDEVEILYAIAGDTAWPGLDDWRELETAFSGNVVILRHGQYGDTAVLNNTELMPRTVVATTQDQSTLYLLVVDGRSQLSVGMTLKELADFLLYIGAFHALNLDGGGSSELVVKDLEKQRLTVVNRPSDGSERPVPDGLALYFTE